MSTRLLAFVQLELTHALGPAPGRYVVGDGHGGTPGSADVLIIDVAGAPAVKRRRLRGAAEAIAGAEPPSVALALATHVRAGSPPDGDGDGVARRVQACREDPGLQRAWVDEALAVVNRAIRAHRVSCADPYFTELTRTDPRVVRIGYGAAPEVSAGRWRYAFTVQPEKPVGLDMAQRNAPAEVVAAALHGRAMVLEADELLLRGLFDLDQGRFSCAALQLHAAARVLHTEVRGVADAPGLEVRVAALPALTAELEEVTRELPVPGDAAAVQRLHELAEELRGITDAWRAEVLDRFRLRG